LGIEVLIECENGVYRQVRQLIFVGKSGKTYHLPIREGSNAEQLRAAYQQLGIDEPVEVSIMCGPEEMTWVEGLIKETWPAATFGEARVPATSYQGAVGTVILTERYFRAIGKIGFHYFLTQFPEFRGHEPAFSEIHRYIFEGGGGVNRANQFIGLRQHPLLAEMMPPGARPDGWCAHVLCAEISAGQCLAHVQMFISEDWPAPAYTVRLGCISIHRESNASGHAYVYFEDGPKGQFSGEARRLETMRAGFLAPPLAPAISSS